MNRKYNLNYFMQLQKNARLYMTGMTIVAFFMALWMCLYLAPWQPQNSTAFLAQQESDQAIAEMPKKSEAEKPEPDKTGIAESGPDKSESARQSTQPAESEAKPMQQNEPAAQAAPLEKQSADVLQIPGFVPPCSAEPAQKYGFGYNQQYGDYRFHEEVGYQAEGAEVAAVSDGIVKQAGRNAEGTLLLQCGAYQVLYRGLQNCYAAEGERVTAGQLIGTAGESLYVKAEK